MTTFCKDVSNYTVPLTPDLLQQWRDNGVGVGLVIIQAFPPSYHQYAVQRAQMRECAAAGMPFDCYVYDYLGDVTWLDEALKGLRQAQDEEGLRPRKLWLDEEDVETEEGWSQKQRIDRIEWSTELAMDFSVGIYTAAWWWGPKTGNWAGFAGFPLWVAQYDGIPAAEVFTWFGGWQSCRIKQYAGTQPDGTDLNVLSAEEEAELLAQGCDTYKAAIERAVNRLQIELAKKTLSKPLVREIASELFNALQGAA